jgi:acyl-CoA dehydrogenase
MKENGTPHDNNEFQSGEDGVKKGRKLLEEWDASQPSNYFTADLNFQRTLEFHWGLEPYRHQAARLYRFGNVLAREVEPLVRIAGAESNLPRLERFDAWGASVEDVTYHPAYHQAGRHIYNSGVMEVYKDKDANLVSLALFYLSAQNGEAGHNCALACTAGLIKVLQSVGSEELKERYLHLLLNPDYDHNFKGAQYLTEVQGGSDVGANAMTAVPTDGNDIWCLNGEKWFCSNITADLALITARVPSQGEGTRGLGLFLLPRFLEDGKLNSIAVRRLKDKLGTRSLATGELVLNNAKAYQVGPTADGFKNVMTYVINISRIYNAIAVCGNARRAYLVASSYAKHRLAFGRAIVHYPIVQDILANMRSDSTAILSGSLQIARYMDEIEAEDADQRISGFLRLAVNLNKYRSAVYAHRCIVSGIEVLGGNGTIENFSVLPRLLRDNIVYENWEGTHNVLLAQLQRDIRRYQIHNPFFAVTRDLIERNTQEALRSEALDILDNLVGELEEVLGMDELTAGIYFRPLMDRIADMYYAACMMSEAEWQIREKSDGRKLRLAKLFFNRRTAQREPKDIAYYDDMVSRLCLE